MTTQIGRALGARPEEVQRLFTMIGASFFLGLSLVFFYTGSNAIFLTEFEIDTLPVMYIVNAVFVIAVGALYSAVEKRLSFFNLLYRFTAGLAVTIFLFWLGLQLIYSRPLVFIVMTWYRLLFIYTSLGLWELAARMFDIRQAKRLFGTGLLGLTLALIIGGLASGFLVSLIGTIHLFFLSALSLAIYVALLMFFIPRLRLATGGQQTPSHPFPLREMLKDRYIVLIIGLKTLGILLSYLIEFVFYQQASNNYSNPEALASFLGTFMGVTTIATVVTVLLSGRYISWVGIKRALPTYPILLVCVSVVTAIYGTFVGAGQVLQGLVALLSFSDQVFERALFIPVSAILYQPMQRATRISVRVAVDGWLGSAALILSGLMLLVLSRLSDVNATLFIYLIVAVALVFALVTVWTYQGYIRQLRYATRARFSSGDSIEPESVNEFVRSFGTNHLGSPFIDQDTQNEIAIGMFIDQLSQYQTAAANPQFSIPVTNEAGTEQTLAAKRADQIAQIRLIRMVGAMRTPEAVQVLKRYLGIVPRGIVTTEILQALAKSRYSALGQDAEHVKASIELEARYATQILAYMQQVPEDADFIQRALDYELKQVKQYILLLLCFLYEPDTLFNIRRNLAHPLLERRGNAVELLDVTVTDTIKSSFFPLFEDISTSEQLNKLNKLFPQPVQTPEVSLRQIMTDHVWASDWTRVCAFHTLVHDDEQPFAETGRGPTPHENALRHGSPEETAMLALIEKVTILRNVSIFTQTPDAVLAEIAGYLREQHAAADENILQKGDLGDTLYIIIQGNVRVHDAGRTIRTLKDGDIFGELAVLDTEPRSATVTATIPTDLLCLDQEDLYDLMQQRVEVMQGILQVLIQKVRTQVDDGNV